MNTFYLYRKTNHSESADDEVIQENEETAVSDSSAIKESDTKPPEPSIQSDQEQVHSSTTEPLVTETKDQNKQKGDSEDSPADEKKEENSDVGTVTETATPNKKKAAARKRSVGKVSLGKSPRSSKYVILKY